MSAKKNIEDLDISTEEKIKEAARIVFHAKGFSATRTRDIADEAGINLALLNYYFRSKEKLFDIIMQESIFDFMKSLASVINNADSNLEEKITSIIERYIEQLSRNPEMPLFIMSELKRNPENFMSKHNPKSLLLDSVFSKQYQEAVQEGRIANIPFLHFLMNIMGLTIFPFIASPMLKRIGDFSDEEYLALMNQRKAMIPTWIQAIIKPK